MKKYYFLLIAFFAIVYTSCSKLDDPDQPPVTQDPLTNITLQDTLSMYTGNDIQLHFTTTPANYDLSKLVWESSDTTVISVKNTGEIIARNEGFAKVTVSNEAKTKSVSCTIAVKDSLSVGLIAYYPFNNSAADSSGHNHNGVAYNLNSVADRFGKANSAYGFNGINSFILVKDAPALRLSNTDFTITTWIKLDNYNQSFGSQVIDKRISGPGNGWNCSITGQDYLNTGQGNIGLVAFNEGGDNLASVGTKTVALNNWHMITTVYSISLQQISIYIDGLYDRSVNNIPSPNGSVTADAYIGKDNPDVPSLGYYLNGALDDLRIYHRALNANDIKRLYSLTH